MDLSIFFNWLGSFISGLFSLSIIKFNGLNVTLGSLALGGAVLYAAIFFIFYQGSNS